jgi:hypothetical protein
MSPILKLLPFALFCAALPADAAQGPVSASVSACFTPGPESCVEMIADAIDAARSTVRVQAYWLPRRSCARWRWQSSFGVRAGRIEGRLPFAGVNPISPGPRREADSAHTEVARFIPEVSAGARRCTASVPAGLRH